MEQKFLFFYTGKVDSALKGCVIGTSFPAQGTGTIVPALNISIISEDGNIGNSIGEHWLIMLTGILAEPNCINGSGQGRAWAGRTGQLVKEAA